MKKREKGNDKKPQKAVGKGHFIRGVRTVRSLRDAVTRKRERQLALRNLSEEGKKKLT